MQRRAEAGSISLAAESVNVGSPGDKETILLIHIVFIVIVHIFSFNSTKPEKIFQILVQCSGPLQFSSILDFNFVFKNLPGDLSVQHKYFESRHQLRMC